MGNSHKSSASKSQSQEPSASKSQSQEPMIPMSKTMRYLVNNMFQNVKELEEIGIQMKTKQTTEVTKEEQELIIKLYRSFYYPSTLEKMNELQNNLKGLVEMYNQYHFTNIDADKYAKNAFENLQPTLQVIMNIQSSHTTNSNTSNKFTVIYISHYRGMNPKFEKIGEFTNEKSGIVRVITWLIENSEGGFDICDLNQTLEDRCEEGYKGELDEKGMIEYMSEKCNTWNDLKNICANYGNSFFEDNDGWFIYRC